MARPIRLLVACAALLALPAFAQNLVQNGSFETPALGSGNWGIYPAIPNWTLVSGSGAEVQNNVAGAPYAGEQHVELDGNDNSAIEQAVPVGPRRDLPVRVGVRRGRGSRRRPTASRFSSTGTSSGSAPRMAPPMPTRSGPRISSRSRRPAPRSPSGSAPAGRATA
jgi:hypothetical protein